jgi:putative transposase
VDRVGDWRAFLGSGGQAGVPDEIRRHESTGRPLGSDEFVEQLERALGRVLRPCKRGPPARIAAR